MYLQIVDMYKKAHEAIRKNPAREPKEPKEVIFFPFFLHLILYKF